MLSYEIWLRCCWGPGEILLIMNRERSSKEWPSMKSVFLSTNDLVEIRELAEFAQLAKTLGTDLRSAIGNSLPQFCEVVARCFIDTTASAQTTRSVYTGEKEENVATYNFRRNGFDANIIKDPIFGDDFLRFFAAHGTLSQCLMLEVTIDLATCKLTSKQVGRWEGGIGKVVWVD